MVAFMKSIHFFLNILKFKFQVISDIIIKKVMQFDWVLSVQESKRLENLEIYYKGSTK